MVAVPRPDPAPLSASAHALLTVLPRPGIKKFSEIQFNRNVSSASIVLRIIPVTTANSVLGQGSLSRHPKTTTQSQPQLQILI